MQLPAPPETTPATFAYYFPTAAGVYEGRFIVGAVHQLRLTGEVGLPDEVGEAADNGAYLMEFSPNADYALTAYDAIGENAAGVPWGIPLPSTGSPRPRRSTRGRLAQTIYGFPHRAYGYVYGGSGGGTMSAGIAENTINVWDGVLPFVLPHTFAIPSAYTFRFHSLRILRQGDPNYPASQVATWNTVVDAVDPGGSGDPYALLNPEQAAALRETTLGGFPLPGWYQHPGMAGSAFFLVASYPPLLDPTYPNDFWSVPGYLGADSDPNNSTIWDYRIKHPTTITAASPPIPPVNYNALGPAYNSYMLSQYITGPPRTVTLASLPPASEGVLAGEASVEYPNPDIPGQTSRITIGMVDRNTNTITFVGGAPPHLVNQLEVGMDVAVSNEEFLALATHHRHQFPYDPPAVGGVPGGSGLYTWDQFKKPNGTLKYPQRPPPLIGAIGNYNSVGAVTGGHWHGPMKMIVMQGGMDLDAFPWGADWYRDLVRADQIAQGRDPEDHFRLWFTEHALHGGGGGADTRTINYSSTLQQALLDLEGWRERGEVPPDDSVYDVVDNQVILAPTAAERRGVTPVVHLNGQRQRARQHRCGRHRHLRHDDRGAAGLGRHAAGRSHSRGVRPRRQRRHRLGCPQHRGAGEPAIGDAAVHAGLQHCRNLLPRGSRHLATAHQSRQRRQCAGSRPGAGGGVRLRERSRPRRGWLSRCLRQLPIRGQREPGGRRRDQHDGARRHRQRLPVRRRERQRDRERSGRERDGPPRNRPRAEPAVPGAGQLRRERQQRVQRYRRQRDPARLARHRHGVESALRPALPQRDRGSGAAGPVSHFRK